jgi:hypothetical protein
MKRILMEGEIEKIYIQLVQGKTQNIEVLENVNCLHRCHHGIVVKTEVIMSESCGPFPGKTLVTFRIIFSLFLFAVIFPKSLQIAPPNSRILIF